MAVIFHSAYLINLTQCAYDTYHRSKQPLIAIIITAASPFEQLAIPPPLLPHLCACSDSRRPHAGPPLLPVCTRRESGAPSVPAFSSTIGTAALAYQARARCARATCLPRHDRFGAPQQQGGDARSGRAAGRQCRTAGHATAGRRCETQGTRTTRGSARCRRRRIHRGRRLHSRGRTCTRSPHVETCSALVFARITRASARCSHALRRPHLFHCRPARATSVGARHVGAHECRPTGEIHSVWRVRNGAIFVRLVHGYERIRAARRRRVGVCKMPLRTAHFGALLYRHVYRLRWRPLSARLACCCKENKIRFRPVVVQERRVLDARKFFQLLHRYPRFTRRLRQFVLPVLERILFFKDQRSYRQYKTLSPGHPGQVRVARRRGTRGLSFSRLLPARSGCPRLNISLLAVCYPYSCKYTRFGARELSRAAHRAHRASRAGGAQ